jgi:hypothetical protein
MNFQESACQNFNNKLSEVQTQGNFPSSCKPMLNIIHTKDGVKSLEVTINFGWHTCG